LHGFVNNKKLRKASKIRIFANDILIIQKQRIVLTGIFFIFATGGHFILINLGILKTPAYIISYISSIFITRIIHTLYGLKTGLFDEDKD